MACSKLRRTITNSQENTSSVAAIAGSDDLLIEILKRLPAKSLLRFKTVSKHFLSLISNPSFSLLWTKPYSVAGIFFRRLTLSGDPTIQYIPLHEQIHSNPPFTSLDFVDDPEGIDILQSCNGLLLCSSFKLRHHSCNYYIHNPTTNQFTTLPRPIGFENRIVRGINLGFDPSKSNHYKVICVYSHSQLLKGFYWIQIYSSETCSWKPYDDIVVGPSDIVFDKGVYWNGSINWVSRNSETTLCFDINEERIKTIPMPPIMEGEKERTSWHFEESYGHLHLAVIQSKVIDVFEMEPDCSKWVVKYCVDLDGFFLFPEIKLNVSGELDYWEFSVLDVVRGKVEDDESLLVMYIAGKVVVYNMNDRTLKKCFDVLKLSDEEDISSHCKGVIGHQYIESLVSV